eukprot:3637857-Rhodomonas_salina.2
MDFMDIVADAVKKAAPALIGQLRYPPIRALCAVQGLASEKGYAVVDNFLDCRIFGSVRIRSGYAISGTDLASDAYGPTCICYPTSGTDLASRAARFDPETEQLVTYDKHNVTYLPTRPLSCNGHVWYSNIPRGPVVPFAVVISPFMVIILPFKDISSDGAVIYSDSAAFFGGSGCHFLKQS